MTPAQVRRKLAIINKHQFKWDTAERELQSICTHPNATKKHCSSTCNWDPNDDSYWIEYKCHDCNKFWMVDQ